MPGVQYSISTQAAGGVGVVPQNANHFASGLVNRGPVGIPIKVTSMNNFIAQCDGRQSFGAIYDDANAFFGEAGSAGGTYYISRNVGSSATAGTLSLLDQGESGGVATLTANAANPGAWSANLNIAVSVGAIANTFNLVFTYTGGPVPVVETYKALTSPADAVATVNAVSQLVTLVNAGSDTAAPNNNPAVVSENLSAGNDERGSVTATTMINGLAVFDSSLGSGTVAIPGQSAATVKAGLEAHASANARIVLSAAPIGDSVASVETLVGTIIGTSTGQYSGLVWPNVNVPNGNGGTLTITPEGAVAGLRARVQASAGPWQPPAGGNGVFQFVVSTETIVDQSDANNLDAAGVSVIRQIGGGPRLYGWRSLSADLINYELLSVQDLLNYIIYQADTALEQYVFQTIDGNGQLLGNMGTTVKNILVPIVTAGGLYPASDGSDPGYTIDTSSDVNTPATLAANEANVAVGVRPAPAADLINFTLTKLAIS